MAIRYLRPDPTQPGWADSGEAVRPATADIAIGWPASQIPPSRQEFNWLDKQQDAAIKYILRTGIAEWRATELYQGVGLAIGSNGSVYWNLLECTGIDPVFDNTGAWEITNIRLSDGDARYITWSGGLGMFLTQAQGDARYQLRADMGAYLTRLQADDLYVHADMMSQFVTYAAGDTRYALRTDLNLFETSSHAAATYLRIVDAANLYLTQSAAAQTYLSIADANGRFAAAAQAANAYADAAASNMNASVRAWVASMLPGLQFSTWAHPPNAGGSIGGRYFIITASPNNNAARSFCVGSGNCQEGDFIQAPPGFNVANMNFGGYVQTIPSADSVGGDALLNIWFGINGATGQVTQCRFHKSNAGSAVWSRGYAYGGWYAFGFN
jgi:hypothetical protein